MVNRVVLVKIVELVELVRLAVLVKLLLFDCCVLSDVAGGLWLGPDVGAATAATEGRRPSQAARGRCCCFPRGQRWGHRTQHAATETQEQHFVRKAANSHSPHTHTPDLPLLVTTWYDYYSPVLCDLFAGRVFRPKWIRSW